MSNDQHHQSTTATTSSSSKNTNNNHHNNTQEYRPCSPDLSAYGIPPHQQQQSLFHPSYQEHYSPSSSVAGNQHTTTSRPFQQSRGNSSALTGLPGGSGVASGYPQPAPAAHRGSYDASPYFSPPGSFSQGSYFVGQVQGLHGQQGLPRRETFGYGSLSASAGAGAGAGAGAVADSGAGSGEYLSRVPGDGTLTYSPTATSSGEGLTRGNNILHSQQRSQSQSQGQGQYQGPHLSQPGYSSGPIPDLGAAAQAPVFQPPSSSTLPHHSQPHKMPPTRRKRGHIDDNGDNGDGEYTPESSTGAPRVGEGGGASGAKTSRKRKSDSGHHAWTVGRAPGEVGPSLGIDIKTKFPVARIKRIMQADEDVGKVAQATPTAVCEFKLTLQPFTTSPPFSLSPSY